MKKILAIFVLFSIGVCVAESVDEACERLRKLSWTAGVEAVPELIKAQSADPRVADMALYVFQRIHDVEADKMLLAAYPQIPAGRHPMICEVLGKKHVEEAVPVLKQALNENGCASAAAIALEVDRQPTTDRFVVQASAISATFVRCGQPGGSAVENGSRFGMDFLWAKSPSLKFDLTRYHESSSNIRFASPSAVRWASTAYAVIAAASPARTSRGNSSSQRSSRARQNALTPSPYWRRSSSASAQSRR